MNTQAAASLPQQIAIALIGSYQKHLSPRKGFSCAHRILYGGESCSQYIKRMIAPKGLVAAARASRQRFQACREANEILKARYSYRCQTNLEQESERRRTRRKTSRYSGNNNNCPGQEIVDCLDLSSALDCGGADCGVFGSNCSAPDCGSGLDCGAVDCGTVDCCSWG